MSAVIRATLDFDGTQIEDFKSVTSHEVTRNKRVKLMNKTTTGAVTPEYGFDMEYVVPSLGAMSFAKVKDAVVKVYYEGGATVTYRGVTIEKEGEEKLDGENELVKILTFIATDRDPK